VRRAVLLVLSLASLVAVVLAPGPTGWGPSQWGVQSSDPEVPRYRAVSGAVLGCPELAAPEGTASVLAGLVAAGRPSAQPEASAQPGSAQPEASAQPGESAQPEASAQAEQADVGQASLQPIDSQRDLARLPAVGEPVTLLVAQRSQPPILLRSSGSWAPDSLAGIATRSVRGAATGLASAACLAPGTSWWFVGAGSQPGRGSALYVSNPAPEPARFDLSVLARSGPVEALAGKGIDLGPRSSVRLRLDALVPDEELLAIHVRATSGRVAAALRDVALVVDDQPQGVDYLPPVREPTTSLWIGAIPGGEGARDLVLANPEAQFATVSLGLLTESGRMPLPGLEAVAVPARSVVTTSLDGLLDGQSATLQLDSDVPITGAVRATFGGSRADVSWVGAAPLIEAPNDLAGAAVVPTSRALATTVTVAAPDGPVSGTLQVMGTGAASGSIFTRRGVTRAQATEQTPEDVPRRGVAVVTGGSTTAAPIDLDVPAGGQVTVTVEGTEEWALAHLVWRSAPGAGPAVVSHLSLASRTPLATGYSWWPVASAVAEVPVREDVGVLAGAATRAPLTVG
jgi:hypothetical protein